MADELGELEGYKKKSRKGLIIVNIVIVIALIIVAYIFFVGLS
jgi:flagellar basal body-associated protein FliL